MRLDDPSLPVDMKLHSLKMLARQIIEVVEAIENEVIE